MKQTVWSFATDCDPPSFNSYVSDEELVARGWTRSVEEWESKHGVKGKMKAKR